MTSFKQHFLDFLASFRSLFTKKSLFIILLDAAFYLFAIVFSLIIGKVGKTWAGSMVASLGSLSYTDTTQQAAIKWVAVKVFIFLVLFLLLILLAWLVSRGIIWALLAGKRYTWSFAWRFSVMNLLWIIIMLVPGFFLFKGLYQSVQFGPTPATQTYYYYHVIFLIIILYLSYLLNYLFTRHERVFLTFKETAKQAVLGFPRIVVPFVLMLATLVVLGFVSKALNALPNAVSSIIGTILFLASFTWAKTYYSSALSQELGGGVKTVKKKMEKGGRKRKRAKS